MLVSCICSILWQYLTFSDQKGKKMGGKKERKKKKEEEEELERTKLQGYTHATYY